MAKHNFFDIQYDSILSESRNADTEKARGKGSILFRITLTTFKIVLGISLFLFVILPIIYKNSYALQRSTVFLNFVNVPPNADYSKPQKYGLKGSRNFYITTDDGIKLGVWQILPYNVADSNETGEEFFENILSNGQNIVVYNHGNGGTRLTSHRVELYKVLRKHFHVIAYDYRSYGDSTNVAPTELSVVNDSISVYRWVQNRTKGNIFMWGHSLGTSISTRAVLHIETMNIPKPVGLILESPFNNMKEEISEFPLAKIFKFLPWFHYTVVEPMAQNFRFETDKYICEVNVPIMILHAKDDKVVPYKLGCKLYETGQQCRHNDQGHLFFHSFNEKHNFGHKFICRASDLPEKIRTFVEYAIKATNEEQLQY